MSEQKETYNLEMNTTRLEAFTDGVFAIAITLLIIEVKVPSHADLEKQSLLHYIYHEWPKYFAYVFSFVNLGIYWANHHYLFKLFCKTDHYFNLLNLLFLLTIAFFPYPAGILGEYIMEEDHRKGAVIFYNFCIWMPSLTWFLMWSYARRRQKIIDPRLAEGFVKRLSRLYLLSNGLFLFAFLVALVNPFVGISLSIALTLVYLLPPKKPEYQ